MRLSAIMLVAPSSALLQSVSVLPFCFAGHCVEDVVAPVCICATLPQQDLRDCVDFLQFYSGGTQAHSGGMLLKRLVHWRLLRLHTPLNK